MSQLGKPTTLWLNKSQCIVQLQKSAGNPIQPGKAVGTENIEYLLFKPTIQAMKANEAPLKPYLQADYRNNNQTEHVHCERT